MNGRSSFLEKIEAYQRGPGRHDPLLSIYKRLQVRPIAFWNPLLLFVFFVLFGQFFFSLFMGASALLIRFSLSRFVVFVEVFLMWQLLLITVPLAVMGVWMNLRWRRKLAPGRWGEIIEGSEKLRL